MKRTLLNNRRARRTHRSAVRIEGTASRPRLVVFRSNTTLYAQIIDDGAGRTLASASTREVAGKEAKSAKAAAVGELLAKKATEKKITKVVFDRRGYAYHGRVKALAEGARKGGLQF